MNRKRPMREGLPVFNPWNEGFSAKVPNWLLRRPEISAYAKLAYARLVQYAGKNGCAYPCVATLGREIGVERRQATRYLEELREYKLILVESGKAKGVRNSYYFVEHEWKFEGLHEIGDDEEGGRTNMTYPPGGEKIVPRGRTTLSYRVGQSCPT